MRTSNVFRTLAVVAAFATLAPSAFSQVVTGSVTTQVNLTSKCRWQGGTAPTGVTVDFGTYAAFQTTANTAATANVVFECTRGFGTAPTISWDGSTAYGVVAGLNYQLSVSAPVRVAGTAATAAAAGIGSADTVTYTLGGTMPADQVGAGAGGAGLTATRTLTVSF
jgi:hypothetical protein